MGIRKVHSVVPFVLAALLVLGLVIFGGCKEKTEVAKEAETEQAVSESIVQTTCPVMAGPINKDMYTEYKGKKVYFCCAGCKVEFEKNPEKYLDKLPQFKK